MTLALRVVREFDGDFPFVLTFDDDALQLALPEASSLVEAGRRIARELERREPREMTSLSLRVGLPGGSIEPFELGVAVDPLAIVLTWGSKRLCLRDEQGDLLLHVLRLISQAVREIGRASGLGFNNFGPPPPPGERWRTWRPQLHRVDADWPGW